METCSNERGLLDSIITTSFWQSAQDMYSLEDESIKVATKYWEERVLMKGNGKSGKQRVRTMNKGGKLLTF